ncbi:MAG: efflux RND transporter periplasmic adaptor subunit [Ignavibacteriales bacterium]|nr:efflux RND transporter periplasmic adaptor subunit [Candidatus Cloacimonadota bacterium]MCF8307360.1 efflux RND transporter periplasmic adaptor subunit [Ignavibacteriales bacterium]
MDRKIEKKKWTTQKLIWISLGVIFIAVVLYTTIWGDHRSKFNVQRERISIETVTEGNFQDYITVTGTVVPSRTVYLDALEGGYVEEVLIEEGSIVKKGDIILRLSNANLYLSIMNQEADLADQMNNLRSTRLSMEQNKLNLKQQLMDVNYQLVTQERDYLSKKELFEKDFISREEYLKSQETYDYYVNYKDLLLESQATDSLFRAVQIEQLENSVINMGKNLDMVREKLESLNLRAPIDGQLVAVNAEVGEAKSAGQRLGEINVTDSFKINMEIDEHYISRTHRELVGEFDFAGSTFQLEITKIYPEVQNGRFSVDLEFSSEQPANLRTGQTFRIKLELGESSEALLLPRGGFYQSTGGQYIFVLSADESYAEKRDIRLGRMNPRYYEVLEGLSAGEKVIVSSYANFGEADKLIMK